MGQKRKKDRQASPADNAPAAPERLNDSAFAGLAALAGAVPAQNADRPDAAEDSSSGNGAITERPPRSKGTTTSAATTPSITWPAKLVVRREKKGRGGKTVTRVQGLPGEAIEALLPRMKKGLGCGAVREQDDLVLLGSLVPRAAAWLRQAGARSVIEAN